MGITVGSREVPGRKGLWQEMMMICDGQKRERPPKTEETEPAMK